MTELICIVCPKGCKLKIDENLAVTGNGCKRGITYGISELTNPTRMLTSTVRIKEAAIARLPVRTLNPIPKNKIFEVMRELGNIEVMAPVKVNDVVISNVCGLEIDIIATRNLDKMN